MCEVCFKRRLILITYFTGALAQINVYDDRNQDFNSNIPPLDYNRNRNFDNGRNVDNRNFDGRNLDGRNLDGRNPDGRNPDGRNLDGRNFDGRNFDGRNDGRNFDERNFDGRNSDGRNFDGRNFNDQNLDRNNFDNVDGGQNPNDRRFGNQPLNGDIRQLLQALDVQASQQCTNNVAAQWNFETNVNQATQLEAVSKFSCLN